MGEPTHTRLFHHLHDERCMGDCGPCGGTGGVEMNRCIYCGGTGKCAGCARPDPGSYTVDPDGRIRGRRTEPQPIAQLFYDVEYVCAIGRNGPR